MRWGGLAALHGGPLCLLLTPIQAFIFNGADSPPLVLAARPLLDLADRVQRALGPRFGLDAYYFYGRMFFLVYLAAIAGIIGLHALQSGRERRELTWFRVVLAGLVLALVGDVVAYWGGSGDISESPVQGLGFTFEMLAVLAALIGSVFYGRVTLRGKAVPNSAAWLLVLAGPAAVPVLLLVGYIPHGAVLPLSLAMAVVGYFLLTRGRGEHRQTNSGDYQLRVGPGRGVLPSFSWVPFAIAARPLRSSLCSDVAANVAAAAPDYTGTQLSAAPPASLRGCGVSVDIYDSPRRMRIASSTDSPPDESRSSTARRIIGGGGDGGGPPIASTMSSSRLRAVL